VTFYRETIQEMKKVTWPDKTQVRQLSIGVIVLSLFVGLLIFVIDWLLQLILVRGIPSIFRG
jgi:preprotein translocase subunit SecE